MSSASNFPFIVFILILILVNLTSGSQYSVHRMRSLTNPPTATSDPCIKPVNETIYPKCKVTFREEGSFGGLNATCLEDNVFLMTPNRTRSRSLYTKDYTYLSSIFDAGLPPYARITCTSLFPTDFDFEGVGALDFFRVWKAQRRTTQNTTYTTNAEILLTPEATGKYIVYSVDNPGIRAEFFIFSERGVKPFMIGGTRIIPAVKVDTTTVIIPCISSDMAANVTLFKRSGDMVWSKYRAPNTSQLLTYDRQQGFIMSPIVPGEYRCFTDNRESVSTDYVTVHVNTTAEDKVSLPPPSNLKMEISNTTAVCYSTVNRTGLKFSNAHARNPTETRLLELCLQRKSQYCGSHSYHERREGRVITGRSCPNNAPTCAWITDIHAEGIFYCETEIETETLTREYFTGLDGKVYDNFFSAKDAVAPVNTLIRPEWRPNGTALKTATLYEFQCEAVGLLFLKDPFTLSVKYKNGTVDKLAELVWWQGSRSLYLTTEMDEIICSDNLWTTNELVNSSTKITVIEKSCDHDQFKCRSGQCIRETWQCDGDKDCADGSDEELCAHHNCKHGHFKCKNGLCILNDKKCNNKNECLDGSDETAELCSNLTCTADDFKCTSGQCTPAHFLCDGDKDCFDQSDEDVKHCAKFYPQFTQTRTQVTFAPNSLNELICSVSLLPLRLKPAIAWWRRGENISDPERLWQDHTGLKLALRFDNITEDDNGEFTCVATNKLQRVVQVFTVTVKLPDADLSCRPALSLLDCVERGCVYDKTKCINPEDTTTTTETPKSSVTEEVNTEHPALSNSTEDESGGGSAIAIGIALLLICVVGLVLSGLGWRYFTRRHVPAGSARMRDDHEVVLNGI